MGTYLERLEILINANSAGAVKGLGQTTEAALGTEVATSKLGKALPIVGTAALLVGAAVYSSVKAYDEAHRSVLQLENSLKNNSLLAGENKQKYLDLADALQQKTAADGDQIVSAEAILGTFRMTGDQILALTPLVVDYARKFDTDLVSAAKQVGKAMDGQVGALKRNGVTIDEVRFKTDRYGAVQAALRDQVGGFAEAEGKTFSGRLETLKNNVGDLQEAIGGELAPVLTAMVEGITVAVGALDDFGGGVVSVAGTIGTYFGYILGGPLVALNTGVNLLGKGMTELAGGSFNAVANSAQEYKRYLEDMGLSQDEVNAKLADYKSKQEQAGGATDAAAGSIERQTNALKAATDATFAKLNADLSAQGSLLGVEAAQNSYNKSLQDNGADALETRQALNQYEQSMVSAATAAGKAAAEALGPNATGQEKARANTQAQIDTLTYLAATASPAAAAAIQTYIDKLKSTPEYIRTTLHAYTDEAETNLGRVKARILEIEGVHTATIVVNDTYTAGGVQRRAGGGPVNAGQPYLIGERGPELMVPNSSGTVVPNNRLGAQSSYSVNVTVNAGMGSDPGQIGAAVVDSIKAYERRSGTAWRN